MEPVLQIRNLHTYFFTHAGVAKAVNGVSLTVERGEVVGLVGESGSGKTVTGFSVLGLLERPGRIVEGEILLKGRNIVGLPDDQMRAIRGHSVAMIFQDPMMTLNPVVRIGRQMIEAIRAHQTISVTDARAKARDALARVGIPAAEERLDAHPHQFSGGMRQRVAIAIALLHNPDIIIADEPTTALDVTIQSQILSIIQKLARETGTSLLWISHDLAVVSSLSDRVAVMYAGRIVESGPTDAVLARPHHPYAEGLLKSVPSLNRRGQPLAQIPGMAPSLLDLGEGCSFRARCARAVEACAAPVKETVGADGRTYRCIRPLNRGADAEQTQARC